MHERRFGKEKKQVEDKDEIQLTHSQNSSVQYLLSHPRTETCYQVIHSDNHNFLPNIVGGWFPERGEDENTKAYYYVAMLAILKPWRDLGQLKSENNTWESAFLAYMRNASQRDKDVTAGCQYYYKSKNVIVDRDRDEATFEDMNEIDDDQL
jgi:hypothetical protein